MRVRARAPVRIVMPRENSMPTKDQIVLIHVLKSKLKLPDEHYRDMLAAFKVCSSKDLSDLAAREFIDTLKARLPAEERQSTRHSRLGNRDARAFPQQLRLIEALWATVSRQPTLSAKQEALNTFLARRFGVSRIEWLPRRQVGKVVFTLKRMQHQEENRVHNLASGGNESPVPALNPDASANRQGGGCPVVGPREPAHVGSVGQH